VGLDAFSVPMQGAGAGRAEHRMLYTALLYTPQKEHSRYLVGFELDSLAAQVRTQTRALGIQQVSELIVVTDGGNGLEEALQRHLAEDLTTIRDWYHAAEHLCDFAKVRHARDDEARQRWLDNERPRALGECGQHAYLRVVHSADLFRPCLFGTLVGCAADALSLLVLTLLSAVSAADSFSSPNVAQFDLGIRETHALLFGSRVQTKVSGKSADSGSLVSYLVRARVI
jgi:hypothetical protein